VGAGNGRLCYSLASTRQQTSAPRREARAALGEAAQAGGTQGLPTVSSKESEGATEQEGFDGWDMDPEIDIDMDSGDSGLNQEEGEGRGGTVEDTPAGEGAPREGMREAQEASTAAEHSGAPGADTPECTRGGGIWCTRGGDHKCARGGGRAEEGPSGGEEGAGGGGARRKLGVIKKGTAAPAGTTGPAGTATAAATAAPAAPAANPPTGPLTGVAAGAADAGRRGPKAAAGEASQGRHDPGGYPGSQEGRGDVWERDCGVKGGVRGRGKRTSGGRPRRRSLGEGGRKGWTRAMTSSGFGGPVHPGYDQGQNAGAGAPGAAGEYAWRGALVGRGREGWGEEWGEEGGEGERGQGRAGEGVDEVAQAMAHHRRLLEGLRGTLPVRLSLDVVRVYQSLITRVTGRPLPLWCPQRPQQQRQRPRPSHRHWHRRCAPQALRARPWWRACGTPRHRWGGTTRTGSSGEERDPQQRALVVHLRHILRCQLWEQLTAAASASVASLKQKGAWADEDPAWGVPQAGVPPLRLERPQGALYPCSPPFTCSGSCAPGTPPVLLLLEAPLRLTPAPAPALALARELVTISGTPMGCWLPVGVPSGAFGAVPWSLQEAVGDREGDGYLLWGPWVYDWPSQGGGGGGVGAGEALGRGGAVGPLC